MATVQDLAQELRRVLALLDQAMAQLGRAAAEFDSSITSWTQVMSGSLAPESGQVAANLAISAGGVDEVRATAGEKDPA